VLHYQVIADRTRRIKSVYGLIGKPAYWCLLVALARESTDSLPPILVARHPQKENLKIVLDLRVQSKEWMFNTMGEHLNRKG